MKNKLCGNKLIIGFGVLLLASFCYGKVSFSIESTKLGIKCDVSDNTVSCRCKRGWSGDVEKGCNNYMGDSTPCEKNEDCPKSSSACLNNVCAEQCTVNICGKNAQCNIAGSTTMCLCPPKTTGDPLVECRPLKAEEMCLPNPCGKQALCKVLADKVYCYCPQDLTGQPTQECVPLK